jgi:uncharacterized protein YdbL (DUF1318 family)
MTLGRRWYVALFVVFLVSCVTVNIYFPASAIQKAADEIVDDVRRAPPANGGGKSDKTSRRDQVQLVGLGPGPAQAAVDLNVSTPAIRGLRASMASRFPQLKPLYDKGAIGETNDGLVVGRDTEALSLRERADLSRLVDQENADRRALYSEIIRANNLDPGTLGEVQRLFANSWREKSAAGWWIQRDDGQWARK